MNILGYIVYYLFMFICIFIILRIITVINTKTSNEEISVPIKFISKKYGVEIRETKAKRVRLIIDIINALAVSIPLYLLLFDLVKLSTIPKYILMVIIFMAIILGGYNLIGLILIGKEK